MKKTIAFTSCMCTTLYPEQPVWDQIKAQSPDHLVLTGDSIYIDATPLPVHPKEMNENDFVQHLLSLYSELLTHKQFAPLVKQVPTHAIWDDHDFLWNEAYAEKAITRAKYKGHVRATRAMFNAFCRALGDRLVPGSFPGAYNDAVFWAANEPAPGYRVRNLGDGVVLHLTDGRSARLKDDMLGSAQRLAIAKEMDAHPPGTVHLLASGSVVEAHHGEHWGKFPDDHTWLYDQAVRHNIIVLSGDVHDFDFRAYEVAPGRYLYDATASGAAIRRLVTLLSKCENYGLLEITDAAVTVSMFSFGQSNAGYPRGIDRATWKLL